MVEQYRTFISQKLVSCIFLTKSFVSWKIFLKNLARIFTSKGCWLAHKFCPKWSDNFLLEKFISESLLVKNSSKIFSSTIFWSISLSFHWEFLPDDQVRLSYLNGFGSERWGVKEGGSRDDILPISLIKMLIRLCFKVLLHIGCDQNKILDGFVFNFLNYLHVIDIPIQFRYWIPCGRPTLYS